MPSIWINDGDVWRPAPIEPFKNEAALHKMIAAAPDILPLSGSPDLTVLGSEVALGRGSADILAVESSGRPAIIEVKLASNAEARRTVAAQVLDYASSLRGYTPADLERGPLRRHLAKLGCSTILEAAQNMWADVDGDAFAERLQDCLDAGHFRLVLALDAASPNLGRIMEYLDAVTVGALAIDLITVERRDVNGTLAVSAQRVSPDLSETAPTAAAPRPARVRTKSIESEGADEFRAAVKDADDSHRDELDKLISWAERVVSETPGAGLTSETNRPWPTLHILAHRDAGGELATLFYQPNGPRLFFKPRDFEGLAPNSIALVERAINQRIAGSGGKNAPSPVPDDALDALANAYKEAAATLGGDSG